MRALARSRSLGLRPVTCGGHKPTGSVYGRADAAAASHTRVPQMCGCRGDEGKQIVERQRQVNQPDADDVDLAAGLHSIIYKGGWHLNIGRKSLHRQSNRLINVSALAAEGTVGLMTKMRRRRNDEKSNIKTKQSGQREE